MPGKVAAAPCTLALDRHLFVKHLVTKSWITVEMNRLRHFTNRKNGMQRDFIYLPL